MAGDRAILIGPDFAAGDTFLVKFAGERRVRDHRNVEPGSLPTHLEREPVPGFRPDRRGAHARCVIGQRDREMLWVDDDEVRTSKLSDPLGLLQEFGVELLALGLDPGLPLALLELPGELAPAHPHLL